MAAPPRAAHAHLVVHVLGQQGGLGGGGLEAVLALAAGLLQGARRQRRQVLEVQRSFPLLPPAGEGFSKGASGRLIPHLERAVDPVLEAGGAVLAEECQQSRAARGCQRASTPPPHLHMLSMRIARLDVLDLAIPGRLSLHYDECLS